MKKIVLVNIDFKDVYTGNLHKAGTKVVMTDERIAEVKAVNPEFVTVCGAYEEPVVVEEPVEEPVVVEETKKATKKKA